MSNPENHESPHLPNSYAGLGRIPVRGERAMFVDCVLEDEMILENSCLWGDIAVGTKGRVLALSTYNGLEVTWFDADLEEGERIPKSSPFTFREIAPLFESD